LETLESEKAEYGSWDSDLELKFNDTEAAAFPYRLLTAVTVALGAAVDI